MATATSRLPHPNATLARMATTSVQVDGGPTSDSPRTDRTVSLLASVTHATVSMTNPADRVEIITSVQRRRRWTASEKVRIVEETPRDLLLIHWVYLIILRSINPH